MTQPWTPDSWRVRNAAQQPTWPDPTALSDATTALSALPPLVFAGETRTLIDRLAQASQGQAFVLQAGDCAESFADGTADAVRDKLKVILQMALVLTYATGVPVVKLGRLAGQYAKPRSSPTEVVTTPDGELTLPSFRGHIVNSELPTLTARTPDPARLLGAYHHSAATLNLLRAFASGGYADLAAAHLWNQQFVTSSPQGQRYESLANAIDASLRFMAACGVRVSDLPVLHQVDFFTSHEALILDYEQALTRIDSLTGDPYDCSAHLLWIGERTRQKDGAHLEFVRGLANPVAVKLGPSATPADVTELCATLNPAAIPGRLTLITRLGAQAVTELLPPLITAAGNSPVLWLCDPMHANTFTAPSGHKTRAFADIVTELTGYFNVHAALGTWPGGIHVELTGQDVTECLGGETEIRPSALPDNYLTICDPRLNPRQALDLAFTAADLLR